MESPNIVFIYSSVCSREDQYKNTTKRQAVESDSDVETEDQFNESIKRKAVDSDSEELNEELAVDSDSEELDEELAVAKDELKKTLKEVQNVISLDKRLP